MRDCVSLIEMDKVALDSTLINWFYIDTIRAKLTIEKRKVISKNIIRSAGHIWKDHELIEEEGMKVFIRELFKIKNESE